MVESKLNRGKEKVELIKYRDLVLATIEYYLDNKLMQIKTADFDSTEHFKALKTQVEEHFHKKKLLKLKQWFRDLTQMQIETVDLKFNRYLQDKTKYELNIFESYFQRVEKIVEKGKITSDKQFFDINIMVNQLSQTSPVDDKKIGTLNRLLGDYKQKKKKAERATLVMALFGHYKFGLLIKHHQYSNYWALGYILHIVVRLIFRTTL